MLELIKKILKAYHLPMNECKSIVLEGKGNEEAIHKIIIDKYSLEKVSTEVLPYKKIFLLQEKDKFSMYLVGFVHDYSSNSQYAHQTILDFLESLNKEIVFTEEMTAWFKREGERVETVNLFSEKINLQISEKFNMLSRALHEEVRIEGVVHGLTKGLQIFLHRRNEGDKRVIDGGIGIFRSSSQEASKETFQKIMMNPNLMVSQLSYQIFLNLHVGNNKITGSWKDDFSEKNFITLGKNDHFNPRQDRIILT